MIRVGCCGFPVAKPRYFETLAVVELQQTFYQPPQMATARKWREQAAPGFEYTLKAWQLITHEPSSPTYRRLRTNIPPSKHKRYGAFKPTDEVFAAWVRTKEIADALKARIIVFQSPASFQPTRENKSNLRRFFTWIASEPYIFVWEPRGEWSATEIQSLCQELDLVHCVDAFQSQPTYGKICYYRLHGRGGYRYKYTQEDLSLLRSLIGESKDAYCMFNNMFMYEDALAFQKLLRTPETL